MGIREGVSAPGLPFTSCVSSANNSSSLALNPPLGKPFCLPKPENSMLPHPQFIHLSWVCVLSFLGVCAFREMFVLIKGMVERAGEIALANIRICFNVEKNL